MPKNSPFTKRKSKYLLMITQKVVKLGDTPRSSWLKAPVSEPLLFLLYRCFFCQEITLQSSALCGCLTPYDFLWLAVPIPAEFVYTLHFPGPPVFSASFQALPCPQRQPLMAHSPFPAPTDSQMAFL